ncbi:hypothetical protein A1D17_25895 [Pseudomonas fluorescens]|uniref:Uncharacterized protein n=1 Tax=Pseudomonas fluorescens TaxID=294 RepID=A0A161ZC04_PSEFL|nr:hypothetical protein A1D17_25895 [Pseudomonas fluorescens]
MARYRNPGHGSSQITAVYIRPKLAHGNSRLSFQQLIAHDARFCRFWFFLESVCNSYFRQAETFHAGLT